MRITEEMLESELSRLNRRLNYSKWLKDGVERTGPELLLIKMSIQERKKRKCTFCDLRSISDLYVLENKNGGTIRGGKERNKTTEEMFAYLEGANDYFWFGVK
tara:strand:- start:162 stop:470 length:309 start_codon:yes stop_codon:yes gene_type:complete